MSVHASEIVGAIRAALAGNTEDPFVRSVQAPTQSDLIVTPNPDQPWKNRDGKIEFDCVGRDWIRAFRVTVEAIPVQDFRGDFQS